jgi:hypothetical protein
MAAADHVLVQLSIDSVGLARAGFGVPLILSHNADFVPRVQYYSSIAAVGDDFDTDSPEYLAANAMFAQTPKPRLIAIGRATGSVTQRYDIEIAAVAVGQEYAIEVVGEGVTDTTVSYTPAADLTFVDGDITTGTDTIAKTAHGMETGAGPFRLSNSGGALPAATPSLAVDTNVWIIAPTADTFKLAASKADAIALTAIDITAAAGGGTHTLRRAQNDVICAQLVQGLNAVAGKNYTAVQTTGAGETDTVRVTATAAGDWFSLEINTPSALGIVQSHAAPSDVTLAADLAAILLADQGWYCLIPLYPSTAYILDVAAWVESNGRICVYDVVETDSITTSVSGGTDLGAQMLALGYTRTMGCYHHIPAQFFAAAWMGRWLPTDPGKCITKYRTLVGVTPSTLTDTHKINLRGIPAVSSGRRMNAYEQVLADRAFAWEGTVFSSVYRYIDVTRNADWLVDGANAVLLGVFVGTDIVPYTPEGIALMEGALRGFVRDEAVSQGVLSGTPLPTVTAPDIDDVSDADKAARNLGDLKFDGTLAGAIQTAIPVTGVLTF